MWFAIFTYYASYGSHKESKECGCIEIRRSKKCSKNVSSGIVEEEKETPQSLAIVVVKGLFKHPLGYVQGPR